MLRAIGLITVLLFSSLSHVFAAEIKVEAKLNRAQVYLSGAQVFHTTQVRLPAGTSRVVFDGIAGSLNAATLRTALKGDATFVSMNERRDMPIDSSAPGFKNIQRLQDSITSLSYYIEDKQAEKAVLEEEQKYISGQLNTPRRDSLPLDIERVERTADFIGRRLGALKLNLVAVNRTITESQRAIQALQDSVRRLNTGKPRHEVVVTIFTERATTLDLGISYMIDQAGWSPSYDIRVPDIDKSMELDYKALVWQNSGINWEDIAISVSTRNPGENSNHPVVNPWMIGFITPRKRDDDFGTDEMEAVQTYDLHANVVRAQINQFAFEPAPTLNPQGANRVVEFTTTVPASIPTGGEAHMVSLQSHELKPLYEYYAVPRLDPDAFLLARITGWSKYNLLPGKVNVYFRENFVGTTQLNPFSITDTISVSLGRDRNVVVKRESRINANESSFLGNDIERTFDYTIFIRNTYAQPITLTLEEPIPKAAIEDIEVDLDEDGGGEFHRQKNSLRWRMELGASANVQKNIRYTVTYPGDRQVYGL